MQKNNRGLLFQIIHSETHLRLPFQDKTFLLLLIQNENVRPSLVVLILHCHYVTWEVLLQSCSSNPRSTAALRVFTIKLHTILKPQEKNPNKLKSHCISTAYCILLSWIVVIYAVEKPLIIR